MERVEYITEIGNQITRILGEANLHQHEVLGILEGVKGAYLAVQTKSLIMKGAK